MTEFARNLPAIAGADAPLTMSSREIADLCEKNHADVLRDVRVMLEQLGEVASKFAGNYVAANGKANPCYSLPKDMTLTLVAGYNVVLRKRIIDRWLALEERAAAAPAIDLNDPAQLRGLLLSYSEKAEAQAQQIAAMRPAVQALDRISQAEGSLCITDAAKALQVRPSDLFAWLRRNGWIYRRPGAAGDLGYQAKVITGLLEHKVTTVLRADGSEKVTEQVRVTAKGLTRLAQLVPSAVQVVK